ncbi:hypothetical protein ABGB17_26940 [Sphaerisporangium sp. B11E5]|uniref:hypothetical protein n=1 Tax=Sphaerisporangium sp. B11E5 TaxID=3153563 RepID=UPI00325E531C
MSPGSPGLPGRDRHPRTGPGWDELIARRPRRWAGGVRDRSLSRVAYDTPAVSAVSPADVPGRAGEDWPEGEYACVGVRFAARLEPPPRGRRYVAVYLRVRLDDRRAAVVDLRASHARPPAAGPGGAPGDPGGWGPWAWPAVRDDPEVWAAEDRGPGGAVGWGGGDGGAAGWSGGGDVVWSGGGAAWGELAGPRVSATGLGGAVFDWLFGDVAGRDEVTGTVAAYALLRVPSGLTRLTGELRVHSSVRRPALWRGESGPVEHVRARAPWRFAVPVPPLVTPAAQSSAGPAGRPSAGREVPPLRLARTGGGAAAAESGSPRGASARGTQGAGEETRVRLCLAADMERFSRFRNPEAVRAQGRLADALERAREHAGLAEGEVDLQRSGDGQFAVLPGHLDETVVIPLLVEGLGQALAEVNADLSEHARVRLRVAVHRGLTTPAGNGWVGEATIAVRRILDSPAAREALAGHPEADFVLIVPDALYRDVIGHGYGRLRPETFHQVEATLPEKGFTERAWIHVPAT